MASGYGLAGGETISARFARSRKLLGFQWGIQGIIEANVLPGPSRCFPFWQELLACYVVNTNTDDVSGGKKCLPVLEDYYECLHHKKEVNSRR